MKNINIPDSLSSSESLSWLCRANYGIEPETVSPIKSGGGDRRYFRLLLGGKTIVGAECRDVAEAKAFIDLCEVFRSQSVPVPAIYCHSKDYRYYLMQDLGNVSLYDVLKSPEIEIIVTDVLRRLVKMQVVDSSLWQHAVVASSFSHRQIMWDLNYFKYEFAKPAGSVFDEDKLEDDFEALSRKLIETPDYLWGFMMRDCQSRNVMLTPEPVFIDFQAGRYGPGIYDAVSLLWQAKACFTKEFRHRMISFYAKEFQRACKDSGAHCEEKIEALTPIFALFRTLQVLGAYGFRGLVEKKTHFIESIPYALNNLECLIQEGELSHFPELEILCRQLCKDTRFKKAESAGKLHIKVFSFSYKKGYPEDLSGNGGGFMFDCRGLHNPGRYEQYKSLTGRDQPVIDFLRDSGDADKFASAAVDLISPTVECYLRRGFDSLQVGFGCTGGRHRSVYCAESVAHALKYKFPDAVVHLIHREQDITELID